MTEKPILFSGPMVRAILAGTKTQTRRVVSPSLRGRSAALDSVLVGGLAGMPAALADATLAAAVRLCPYDADRLWVRETWAMHHAWDTKPPGQAAQSKRLWYRADTAEHIIDGRGRWRPSIYMPRWASRLTLPVESIRVERLQDITEADAIAEGVGELGRVTDARGAFVALWESINGKRPGCSWADDPWVWVVSFPREVPRGE